MTEIQLYVFHPLHWWCHAVTWPFNASRMYVWFARPVFPSGDGGVWESCCSSSPSDRLPYSTWPSTSFASSAGEAELVHAHSHIHTFTFMMPLFKPELCLLCQGLCGHTALWKDQLREAAGTLGAVVPATHADWYTEGKTKLVGAFSITSSLISAVNIGNCHLLVFYGWYMLSFHILYSDKKNLDELIILNQKVNQQQ